MGQVRLTKTGTGWALPFLGPSLNGSHSEAAFPCLPSLMKACSSPSSSAGEGTSSPVCECFSSQPSHSTPFPHPGSCRLRNPGTPTPIFITRNRCPGFLPGFSDLWEPRVSNHPGPPSLSAWMAWWIGTGDCHSSLLHKARWTGTAHEGGHVPQVDRAIIVSYSE